MCALVQDCKYDDCPTMLGLFVIISNIWLEVLATFCPK